MIQKSRRRSRYDKDINENQSDGNNDSTDGVRPRRRRILQLVIQTYVSGLGYCVTHSSGPCRHRIPALLLIQGEGCVLLAGN